MQKIELRTKLNNFSKTIAKNVLFCLILYFFIHSTISQHSITPTTTIQYPYYFGSRQYQFYYAFDNNNTYFQPSQTYQYRVATLQEYRNVTKVQPILSQFQNNGYAYFGFSVLSYITVDPVTSVTVNFTVDVNSIIALLAFNVFLVCKPFDEVFTVLEFYIDGANISYPQPYRFPSNQTDFFSYYFLVSFVGVTDASSLSYYLTDFIKDPTTNTVTLKGQFVPSEIAMGINGHFTVVACFINNEKKKHQFSLIYIKQYNPTINVFPTQYFSVETNIFGTDIQYKCLFGFNQIRNFNKINGQFKYHLDGSGVSSGIDNSIANTQSYQLVCSRDMICPLSYPFRQYKSPLCYDCYDGNTIQGSIIFIILNIDNTLANCIKEDDTFTKQQYNLTFNQIVQRCLNCIDCENHYYAHTDGTCHLCIQIFDNCIKCDQKIKCLECNLNAHTHLLNITSGLCSKCTNYIYGCLYCNNSNTCTQCIPNFYRVSANVCKFIGCISSIILLNGSICTKCSSSDHFALTSNKICQCQPGFALSYLTLTCNQICGDGLTYILQCDDGNLNQNDGCNNKCKIMSGFECQVTRTSVFCKYKTNLQLAVKKIVKSNDENSAVMYVQATNLYFPFNFSPGEFSSNFNTNMVSVTIPTNPPTYHTLNSWVVDSYNNLILIHIEYNFSIEGFPGSLTLNTENTRYIVTNNTVTLKNTMIGDNNLLRIGSLTNLYGGLLIGMLINNIFTMISLLMGLLSFKYIGLECVLTLQLIFFSQLLVEPSTKWPISFYYMIYLKYSNGYNQFVEYSEYIPDSSIQKKFNFLVIKKNILENYNLSMLILNIIFLVFFIFITLKFIRQRRLRQKSSSKLNKNNKNTSRQKSIEHSQQFNNCFLKLPPITLQFLIEITYRSILQISNWSILQILSCIASYIIISNHSVSPLYTTSESNIFAIFFKINSFLSSLFLFFSSFIVLIVGMSNFMNIFLSSITIGKITKRSEQITYKQFNFIYLLIMGVLILFFNDIVLFDYLYMSVIVLTLHLIYTLLINIWVKPYQRSLKIHRRSLIFHHIIYITFLILVNLVNYIQQIPDLIFVIFGYATMIFCSFAIILTIVRLYYQYRFGEKLELQIQKEEEEALAKIRKKQEQLLQKKIQIFEDQAKKKAEESKDIQMRKENEYLYENQIREEEKEDLLNWLNERCNLQAENQEKYFFDKFDSKPMEWLRKNEREKYDKIMKNKEQIKLKRLEEKEKVYQKDEFNQIKASYQNQLKKSKLKKMLKDELI